MTEATLIHKGRPGREALLAMGAAEAEAMPRVGLPPRAPDGYVPDDSGTFEGERFGHPEHAPGSDPRTRIPFQWASDMPEDAGEQREIVQGMLTAGGMSMAYGESNSGKTYLVNHLAFCITRGEPFLGRQTEQGAVIYVAGEGAASIRRRVRAHEMHFGHKVGAFGLIPCALSLLDPSADVENLIELIRTKAEEIGQQVLMVIVDTVARAMGGANENASEDMSRLVRAGDRIREETGAHLMWIHHSGKDQAKGARGHSSLRAALDTEMEVTADDLTAVHTLTITKQRDLATKGDRLAGRFVPVDLGSGQWGDRITACAVEDAEAPAQASKTRKLSETQQAVLAALAGAGRNLRVTEIASMLDAQGIKRTTVYKAVEKLSDLGMVESSAGVVHLIPI